MLEIKDAEMIFVGIGEEFDNNNDALDAYNKLAEMLNGKNYFVVSLCMDDVIYESGLDESRIVCPMGGMRKKQCPDACTHDLYDINEEKCPNCGKTLIYNNIKAENYVEEGYLPQWQKHKLWLTGTLNKKLLLIELGVSMRFPQIIRWPFERLAGLNNKAFLIRVNEKLPQVDAEIADKAMSIKTSSVEWAKALC